MSVVTNHDEPLLHRHPANPILTSKDWPYSINSVFNAGATLLEDGSTLLLCRVEERRGLSHLCAARSANGVDGWQIDPTPTLMPNPDEYPEELWGIEDPRLTYVPELQQYAVVYTSYSRGGPGVSLALTKDFRSFERYGVIMSPDDKDAALLPRRIGGRLGTDPSADDSARRSHLDLVLSRPATLGQSQGNAGGPPRRVVGRKQDRAVFAAHRNRQRLADALPRSTADAFRLLSTASVWRCSILRSRTNACCEAIPGSSGRKPTTNVTATSTTSCSRADTRWAPTVTPSISTTARPTPASHWLTPAFAVFWLGWMSMEVANARRERRIYETPALDSPIWPSDAVIAS